MTLGDQILQFIISGITSGCIYTIVGMAIAVVYNVTRIFDVSQGQYVILGAMIVCSFRKGGFNTPLSIILAFLIPLIIGFAVWRIIFYGPSKKYPTITLIMITVGVAMLIEGMIFFVFGTDIRTTPYYLKVAPIRVFRAVISPQGPLIYGAVPLMVVGLSFLFGRTLLGKGLRACHEQPLAARLMGINTQKMMFFSFILSLCIGAMGGIVMVPLTAASYSMGMDLVIKGFLAALVGGISRFPGVIIGGLSLGLLESFSAGFISSSYASIITLTVFVVALLFRPTGFIGSKEIRT